MNTTQREYTFIIRYGLNGRKKEKKQQQQQQHPMRELELAVSLNMIIYSNKKERKTVCQIYGHDRAHRTAQRNANNVKLARKKCTLFLLTTRVKPRNGETKTRNGREREKVCSFLFPYFIHIQNYPHRDFFMFSTKKRCMYFF